MSEEKYNLHCFGCGELFNNKEEVYRNASVFPICGECLADIASAEQNRFLEEEWYRKNPGKDPEEEHRKQVYIAKYGEY